MGVIFGWSYAQWKIAFAEAGVPFGPHTWHAALLEALPPMGAPSPGTIVLDKMVDVQTRWEERHAYAPGKSPLVLSGTYRVRT